MKCEEEMFFVNIKTSISIWDLFNENNIWSKATLSQFIRDGGSLSPSSADHDLGFRRQIGAWSLQIAGIDQGLFPKIIVQFKHPNDAGFWV